MAASSLSRFVGMSHEGALSKTITKPQPLSGGALAAAQRRSMADMAGAFGLPMPSAGKVAHICIVNLELKMTPNFCSDLPKIRARSDIRQGRILRPIFCKKPQNTGPGGAQVINCKLPSYMKANSGFYFSGGFSYLYLYLPWYTLYRHEARRPTRGPHPLVPIVFLQGLILKHITYHGIKISTISNIMLFGLP